MTTHNIRRAALATLGAASNLGAVVKAATVAPKAPAKGAVPERFALLFVRAQEGAPLSPEALAWISARLNASGYNEKAQNYCNLVCLAPHVHGSDGRCVPCGSTWIRRFATDEDAVKRLVLTARHANLGCAVAPLCEGCKSHDAEMPVSGTDDIGGPVLIGLGAFLVLLTVGAGVAKIEARRLVKALDASGIAIVAPGEEPKSGKVIERTEAALAPVQAAFIATFGESLGKRALKLALSKGWRYENHKSNVSGELADNARAAWTFCSLCRKIGATVGGTSHGLAGYTSRAPSAKDLDKEAGVIDTTIAEEGDIGGPVEVFQGLFEPSEALERKVTEVAAQWSELKRRMDADPKIARAIRPQYDHWIEFWTKWQAGNKDQSDARAIIVDVNVARANALNIRTEADKGRVADTSETNAAQTIAQKTDDAAREAEKKLKDSGIASKLKIAGAAALTTVALVLGAKVAL